MQVVTQHLQSDSRLAPRIKTGHLTAFRGAARAGADQARVRPDAGSERSACRSGCRIGMESRAIARCSSRTGARLEHLPFTPRVIVHTRPLPPWTFAMSRISHLRQFYSALSELEKRLGGPRRLSECSASMSWPLRGVYFFMESGEVRGDTGGGPRVVRVGTHALRTGSKSRLWGRLANHRGPASTRRGNHRGSIFRLIVGTALIEREIGLVCPSWDDGSDSAPREIRDREQELEIAVSKVIGDMPFLWLPVEDEPGPNSLRGYIEQNTIALLSNYRRAAVDPPSESWLGHHCSRERVKLSGLWNSQHVDETYDPTFVETMAHLVDRVESQEC